MPELDPSATVRGVLRIPEFRAILGSSGLSLAGDQVARIAVAVLVYERTGSSFLVAATLACSYLTWLVSGPLLSSLADRLPRRRLMVACDVVRAGLVALLVLPDVPLVLVFAVLIAAGLLSPPFDAAKSALLPEVLPGDQYVVGNAVQGAVFQGAQVAGFLLGGALVAATSARGALALDALTFLASALLLAAWVRERPLPERPPTSLLADTRDGVTLVLRAPLLRHLLGYGALGSLVMIAPEGLAVPVADELGGGPRTVGLLTASVPAGFLVGSFLVLRVPPDRRPELLRGLALLSAVALLATPLSRSTALVLALWTLCGVGAALNLIANAAYMQAVPRGLRGRAFGVAATTLMATQGLVLLAFGAAAEVVGARQAVAASGVLALLLLPLLRRPSVPHPWSTAAAGAGR